MNIIATLKAAGGGLLHLVEAPVEEAGKLETLVSTGVTEVPALKAEVLQLLSLGEKVIGDGASAVGAKGLSFALDVQTFQDVEAFFRYFSGTFLPAAKQLYAEIVGDAPSPAQPGGIAQTGDAGSAQPGPGLHNVVPA